MNKQFINQLFLFLTICLFTACGLEKSTEEQELLLYSTQFGKSDHRVMAISPIDQNITHILDVPTYAHLYLSPDGQKLAMWMGRTLTIVDIKTGKELTKLSNVGQTKSESYLGDNIIWSPDSNKITYEKDSENGVDLWFYDLSKEQEIQVTNNHAVNIFPSWSDDSQNIAFITNEQCKNGIDGCQNEFWWDLATYSLLATNKAPTFITNFAQSNLIPKESSSTALLCNLKWSNDNQFIAFENECQAMGGLRWLKNVYITSVKENFSWQATHFNQYPKTDFKFPDNLFTVSYDWLDKNNVLKVDYSEFEMRAEGKVFHGSLFLPITNSIDELEELQYTNTPIGSDSFLSPQKQFLWHSNVQSSSLEMNRPSISKVDDGTFFQIDFSTPLPFRSCDYEPPHWSKSEKYVVYATDTTTGICSGPAEWGNTPVIIDLDQTTYTTISLPDEDIELLGWTTVNESNR